MEKLIKNENDYVRENYYCGMIEDVRNVFINYGRYLERNDIPKEGSLEDYEIFLQFQKGQEKEFEIDDCIEKSSQRIKEYLEFIAFLKEKQDWGNELIIIREDDWNEFYNRINDDEFEMKILDYVQASEFYNRFAQIANADELKFESVFVSSKYLDTYTYNAINLIVNINGRNERFIIDCV
jgi:hypothetical protein